jgi:hypothetical protein
MPRKRKGKRRKEDLRLTKAPAPKAGSCSRVKTDRIKSKKMPEGDTEFLMRKVVENTYMPPPFAPVWASNGKTVVPAITQRRLVNDRPPFRSFGGHLKVDRYGHAVGSAPPKRWTKAIGGVRTKQ